jgi:hypothetical protein
MYRNTCGISVTGNEEWVHLLGQLRANMNLLCVIGETALRLKRFIVRIAQYHGIIRVRLRYYGGVSICHHAAYGYRHDCLI